MAQPRLKPEQEALIAAADQMPDQVSAEPVVTVPPPPSGMPKNLLHLYNNGITPETAYENWGRAGGLQSIRKGSKFTGRVRAVTPCHYGFLRDVGNEWDVKDQELWTDDPFVPLHAVHTDPATGETTFVPWTDGEDGAPFRADFKTRKYVNTAEDPTPRPASTW